MFGFKYFKLIKLSGSISTIFPIFNTYFELSSFSIPE